MTEMTTETAKPCRCQTSDCGCGGDPQRCTCGAQCRCKEACECGTSCGCAAKK